MAVIFSSQAIIHERLKFASQHVGTSALTIDGGWGDSASTGASSSCLDGRIAPPPDSGAVAFVLRTGFSSSQGKLMQMIEFSQQSVSGDSVETGKLILAPLKYIIISILTSLYI
jgi:magnesium-transporting ATPase (P-type)